MCTFVWERLFSVRVIISDRISWDNNNGPIEKNGMQNNFRWGPVEI